MRQARIQRVSRAVGSIHVLVSRTSGVEEVEVERRRLHSPRCIPSRRRSVGRFWCCVSIRRFVGCDGKQ